MVNLSILKRSLFFGAGSSTSTASVRPGSVRIEITDTPRPDSDSGAAKEDAAPPVHDLDNREFLSQLLRALEALRGQADRRSLPIVAWTLALAAQQVQRDLAAEIHRPTEDAPDTVSSTRTRPSGW